MEEAKAQTISAEKLTALTGLTDRRHRQLAQAGFFPPPVKGQYRMAATIQGMFRHYRQSLTDRDALREAQTRESTARAEKIERENAEASGDTIRTAIMHRVIGNAFLPVRQRLLSLPAICNLCNPTDPAFARRALSVWVDESLPILRAEIGKIQEIEKSNTKTQDENTED